MSLTPARGWDLTTLTYTVELARTSKTFPLAQDLVTLWPLYLVVVGWQVISVLNMLGGARRVRRTMAPLNDLALRVDELGRMQLSGGKMETLEQAIERASVDSPSVTTGDADLRASRSRSTACCARCKRPSCSRCALSTMRVTSCARPSR